MAVTRPELPQICAVMVHDLKNPLAALMTNLRYLVDSGTQQGEAAEAIGDSLMLCDVLDRYLRNLELLARDEVTARRFATPVRALLQEAAKRVEPSAQQSNVTIAIDPAAASTELLADADRDLVARALENVIANAVEHAPKGTRVEVSVAAEASEIAIVVRDARTRLPSDATAGGTTGALAESKVIQGRYGRGLSLLSAEIAAAAAGGSVTWSGAAGAVTIRVAVPRANAAPSSDERGGAP